MAGIGGSLSGVSTRAGIGGARPRTPAPTGGGATSGDATSAIMGLFGGGSQASTNPADLPGGANYIQQQKSAAAGNPVAAQALAGQAQSPIQQLLSGGAVGAPGAPGAPSTITGAMGAGTTNTAQANPVSNDIISTLSARAKGDLGAPENLDRGIQKIRDNASMGIAGEQQMSRIRRGVSGSGIDKVDADQLAKSQQNDINALTKDTVLARERDRDSLLMGTANLGLSQGQQQIQAQQRIDAQHNAAVDAALREKAINTQNQVASFSALLGLLGGGFTSASRF